jgi:hypothetical protein
MTEEKVNPFKSRLNIPVSTAQPPIENKAEEEIKTQKSKNDDDDGAAKLAVLTVKMSPSLHEKYKIGCIKEGTTMQDDALDFVKKRVKKFEEKK